MPKARKINYNLIFIIGIVVLFLVESWDNIMANLGSFDPLYIIVPISLAVFATVIIYFVDIYRERSSKGNFKGYNLFARFGYNIHSTVIPIASIQSDSLETPDQVKIDFYKSLAQELEKEHKNLKGYRQDLMNMKDQELVKDKRNFLRIRYQTTRKSKLNYFIYFQAIGNQILLGMFGYLNGMHKWHQAVWFIMSSPIHFWTWISKWMEGNYSVQKQLNKNFNDSSFDKIDVSMFDASINHSILLIIRDISRRKGLLTMDLEQLINVNIQNTQTFNVKNSNNVSFENVNNTATTTT